MTAARDPKARAELSGPQGFSALLTRVPLGARYMLASALSFSVMSLLVKLAGQRLPSQEIVFARSVVTFVLTTWMLRRVTLSPWGSRHGVLVLRGVLGFIALSCFYFALTRLPLAEATVLQYTSPIWTVLLAVPFLGEGITRVVLLSTVAGFTGVGLIARPELLFGELAAGLDLAAVIAGLTSAFLSAGAYVAVREASKTEHPLVIVYYFSLVSLIGSIPLVVPFAVWPRGWEWLVLIGVGVATQTAQVCLTHGLRLAPAGRAIAIGYSQILFAALWGALFFREYPDLWTVMGAVLVIFGTALASFRGGTVAEPPAE